MKIILNPLNLSVKYALVIIKDVFRKCLKEGPKILICSLMLSSTSPSSSHDSPMGDLQRTPMLWSKLYSTQVYTKRISYLPLALPEPPLISKFEFRFPLFLGSSQSPIFVGFP